MGAVWLGKPHSDPPPSPVQVKFFLIITAQCDANGVRHSNVHLTVLSLFYSKLEPFYSDCLFCSKLEPS